MQARQQQMPLRTLRSAADRHAPSRRPPSSRLSDNLSAARRARHRSRRRCSGAGPSFRQADVHAASSRARRAGPRARRAPHKPRTRPAPRDPGFEASIVSTLVLISSGKCIVMKHYLRRARSMCAGVLPARHACLAYGERSARSVGHTEARCILGAQAACARHVQRRAGNHPSARRRRGLEPAAGREQQRILRVALRQGPSQLTTENGAARRPPRRGLFPQPSVQERRAGVRSRPDGHCSRPQRSKAARSSCRRQNAARPRGNSFHTDSAVGWPEVRAGACARARRGSTARPSRPRAARPPCARAARGARSVAHGAFAFAPRRRGGSTTCASSAARVITISWDHQMLEPTEQRLDVVSVPCLDCAGLRPSRKPRSVPRAPSRAASASG